MPRLFKAKLTDGKMELSDVAAFVKVVQAGSFTQAARLLEAPKSTVSAKVAGLEKRLGVTLLHRTTRQLRVTEDGELFFNACAKALAEIGAAELSISTKQETPKGRLVVTGPVDFGGVLAIFLKSFLAKYPGINVDLILSNRFIDLVGENVDIAIRAGNLKDSSLVAKRLGAMKGGIFASPGYLKIAGEPKQPRDLGKHTCIKFSGKDEWHLENRARKVSVKVEGRTTVDQLLAIKDMALNGLGICLLPTFFCRTEVAKGVLIPVLSDWFEAPTPISIVYPGEKFQHPKTRLFILECAEAIKTYYEF